jgi:hypothetical protein
MIEGGLSPESARNNLHSSNFHSWLSIDVQNEAHLLYSIT